MAYSDHQGFIEGALRFAAFVFNCIDETTFSRDRDGDRPEPRSIFAREPGP